MENLSKKAIKGISWSLLDTLANYSVTFLVGILLARILTPEEFGIVGMISIFISLSNTIVDSGFSSALVRKVDIKHVDYSTTFYFNLVLSIFLYVLLYFLAPSISCFFNEETLIDIIRILGLVLVINSVCIVQRTILVRNVDFKTQTKISFTVSFVGGIVGVVMAMLGFGVWSLVVMQLIRQLLNTILLWLSCSWRPTLEFSIGSFLDLFDFGSKLMISGLIDSLYNNVYHVVIGKFYSAGNLGQFTRANQFTNLVAGNIAAVVQRVSYPVLSSIQGADNEHNLKEVFKRIVQSTMLITFSCVLGLAAVAKPLITLLIGPKWLPSVMYLQILCFGAMLYPLNAINLNILMVKGRSDLFLKLEIYKKMLGFFPVILGILFSIEIMLISGVFVSVISYFLNSKYSRRIVKYGCKDQLIDIYPSFVVAILSSFMIWSLTFLHMDEVLTLFLQILLGISLNIGAFEFFKFSGYLEVKKIVSTQLLKSKL